MNKSYAIFCGTLGVILATLAGILLLIVFGITPEWFEPTEALKNTNAGLIFLFILASLAASKLSFHLVRVESEMKKQYTHDD